MFVCFRPSHQQHQENQAKNGTISMQGAFFVDPFHEISWNPHAQVGLKARRRRIGVVS